MIETLALEASAVVKVDEQYVNIALGVVLPLLVGLVTKRVTSTGTKRVLLAFLSIVGGALAQIAADGGEFILKDVIVGAVVTYFTAQTAYSSVLKPSGIADKVQEKTDRVGVTIKADPKKQAALQGKATTAGSVSATGGRETVVADVGEFADVGDDVEVFDAGDEEPEIEDVPDFEPEVVDDPNDTGVPYDEDPDDEVAVIDPADLPTGDPDEPPAAQQ